MDESIAADRQVSEDEYRRVIRRRGAAKDHGLDNRGGTGVVERWLTPEGEVCAYLLMRYWKGEHGFDYYVIG